MWVTVPVGSVRFTVTSAVGLCIATPVVNVSRTCTGSVEQLDITMIAGILDDMETRARAMLASAGAGESDITVHRSVDVRYKGQGYEIEVPISGMAFSADAGAAIQSELVRRFSAQYERAYGRVIGNAALEVITWRIRAEGQKASDASSLKVLMTTGNDKPIATRPIYFGVRNGFVDTPVYSRHGLSRGSSGDGPALMQERETTVVVPPQARWRVDEQMNLQVRLYNDEPDTRAGDAKA